MMTAPGKFIPFPARAPLRQRSAFDLIGIGALNIDWIVGRSTLGELARTGALADLRRQPA